MDYLALYYDDYTLDQYYPYGVISQAKDKIKITGINRLKKIKGKYNKRAKAYTKNIEELYGLTPEDFIVKGLKESGMSTALKDYDDAVTVLKESVVKESKAEDIAENVNKLISFINDILAVGANMGGINTGAIEKIIGYQDSIENWLASLPGDWQKMTKDEKEKITNSGTRIFGAISGILLEIALAVGYITAAGSVLSEADSILMNTGNRQGVSVKVTKDPKMQEIITDANNQLSNAPKEAHSDLMTITKNKVTGNVDTAFFQSKNFSDIGSIGINTVNKTYRDYRLGNYYDWGFLVNTAGGLGYNHEQNKIYIRHRPALQRWRQKDIDTLWANIKQSVQFLAAADAIAGQFSDINSISSVDFYIIRDKSSTNVKLISVGDIFEKIIKEFDSGGNSALGLSLSDVYSAAKTKKGYRSDFWQYNVDSFVTDKQDSDSSIYSRSLKRSSSAYLSVKNKILEQKISITLNFSTYFRQQQ